MAYMGLNFYINKMCNRYKRTDLMRKKNIAIHYTNNIERITNDYNTRLINSKMMISPIHQKNYNDKILHINTIITQWNNK